MSSKNFWPWDFNSEGEIYENVAWDLPGHRPKRKVRRHSISRAHKPGISTVEKHTSA